MELLTNLALQNQDPESQNTEDCRNKKKILKKRLFLLIIVTWLICVIAQGTIIVLEKLDEETLANIVKSFMQTSKQNGTTLSN